MPSLPGTGDGDDSAPTPRDRADSIPSPGDKRVRRLSREQRGATTVRHLVERGDSALW